MLPLSNDYSPMRQLEVDATMYTFPQKKKEFWSDCFTFYRELSNAMSEFILNTSQPDCR